VHEFLVCLLVIDLIRFFEDIYYLIKRGIEDRFSGKSVLVLVILSRNEAVLVLKFFRVLVTGDQSVAIDFRERGYGGATLYGGSEMFPDSALSSGDGMSQI